jgi:hypothetical protein
MRSSTSSMSLKDIYEEIRLPIDVIQIISSRDISPTTAAEPAILNIARGNQEEESKEEQEDEREEKNDKHED